MGDSLARILAMERRRAVLWAPVLFGLGIWAYFAAPGEPPFAVYPLTLAASVAAFAGAARYGAALAALVALGCALAGFSVAGMRAHAVAAPVLAAPMTALVEGRVRSLSQSASGRPRATLDSVFVYGLAAERMPERVRLTFRGDDVPPPPGAVISVMARLGPPSPPVEPGGFDFRRLAWFDRLGGLGVTRGPAVTLTPASAAGSFAVRLDRLRHGIAEALRARMPGEAGAFAAAIAVGDRSEVPQQALQALRDSNLAHLLAISGLHMAMLCGAAFAALRYGLALIPRAALFLPVKRLAAGGALCVGVAYLLLSGAGTPTQRAFVMVAAALVGAMTNRPAVTLRALALAALIVLLVAPESLLSAGFQMSFAATLALVAVYDEARRRGWSTPSRGALATAKRYALAIAATSLIAGFATAPFAAEHFNRLTTYGFFANLLATPALGLWVAPALLGAAVAAPVGFEAPLLAVAAAGVDWILGVAAWFAGAENAVRPIVTAPAAAWAAVTLGGLWLALWRSAIRWCGAVAIATGVAIWAFGADRPDVLIAPGGGLVGVMTEAGRSLNQGRSERYAAESWLRRDGDAASQAEAAARPLWRESGGAATARLADGRALIVLDRSARRAVIAEACADGALVLAPHRTFSDPPERCRFFDRTALESAVALSVSTDEDVLRIETALNPRHARLWSPAPQ